MYGIGLMVLVASTTLLAGPVISEAGGERERYQGRGISRVDDREGWGKRDDDDRKRERRYGGYGERKYKNDEAKDRGDRRNRYESRNDYRRDGHYNRERDRERHAGRHDREGYDREKYREYPYEPNIPAGHLPPPGHCRDWEFDRPAGHQPPPYKC